MIETRAPGKLFVAGEYAVVEPGQPAVLVAVDRYLTVRLSESEGAGHIHSSEYGQSPLVWVREGEGHGIVLDHRPSDYVLSAIRAVEELRAEVGAPPRYFDLVISSELDDASGRKFGLGSSAAVTTATIAALDEFYGLGLTRTERFKLALLVTIDVAPTASGGDLAASTFGGWIRFTAPDREALRLHRAVHGVAKTLHCGEWAAGSITRLAPPANLQMLVGWTGSPASTERLVEGVRVPRTKATPPYETFTSDSRAVVDALVSAFDDDGAAALTPIREARRLLQRLGTATGIPIETAQLRTLCDLAEAHGAAAKPSGAGGGDCGIAFAEADESVDDILREWERHGIRRLNLSAHPAEGGIDEL